MAQMQIKKKLHR